MDLNDSQVLNLSKNAAAAAQFYANASQNASFNSLDEANALNLSAASVVAAAAAALASNTQFQQLQQQAVAAAFLKPTPSMADFNSLSGSPYQLNIKPNQTKYQQLLSVIEDMSKDIRTTYMGNKNSTERLKRGIASARILVKDCLLECERNTKN